jgi:hypothetical protein
MDFSIKQPQGGPYRIVLDNDRLNISLGNRVPSEHSPSVYVQVKSEFIHSAGIKAARQQVLDVVHEIYDSPPQREQVSRVDLFVDIPWSKRFNPGDVEKFITRAKSKAVFYDGDRVSGFTLGKDRIVARIYNKTLEIRKSGKDWLLDRWGVGEGVTVYRIEIQYRREALKDFHIETFDDLLMASQALWDYAVNDWLSMRGTGKKKARRDLVKFWETVQAAKLDDNTAPLIKRERMRSGITRKQAAAQMAGITRSYARSYGIENLSQALRELIPYIRKEF